MIANTFPSFSSMLPKCSFHSSCAALGNLDLQTIEKGRFLVHCHKTRPTLVLGNTEGIGRLKLVTASKAAPE